MTKPVLIYEFDLDDLLMDPLVALLMRSDHVVPETVRDDMYAIRNRMRCELKTTHPQ
ncbi:hypothetical protein [Asticcacaulis sp. W401b]|uniref:hypothetical protein n=1 Tax=Asticcacaulis sp. W401b TaxID=3388666 RepID=UPI0039708DB1